MAECYTLLHFQAALGLLPFVSDDQHGKSLPELFAVNGVVMLLFDIVFLLLQYFTVEKLLKYLLELNIHLQYNICLLSFEMFFMCFSLRVLCLEKFKVELNCSK